MDDRIIRRLNKSPVSKKIDLALNLYKFIPYSKGMNEEEIQFIFQIEGEAAFTIKDKLFVDRK